MNTTDLLFFTDYNHFVRELFTRFHTDTQGQRIGQYAVNFLRNNFVLSLSIPDEVCCFYDDRLLGDFLTWVSDHWNM